MERKRTLDNAGSSLIVVIIGAAFLGILAALILSITYTNLDLKSANNQSKKNFYVDEVAVNEITAGLEELSSESIKSAYTWLVKNYQTASLDLATCYDDYKKKYMIALSQELNGTPGGSGLADYYSVSKLQDAIRSNEADVTVRTYISDPSVASSYGLIEHSVDAEGNPTYEYMTLKNVIITYKELSGYETSIVTDITMELPISGFVDTAFAKYALISDQFIDCSSSVSVTGGVYAGTFNTPTENRGGDTINPINGGIYVHDQSGHLTINGGGNLVATRENITAAKEGKIDITDAKVWAKNIMTFGSSDETDLTPYINIEGITKVQDDLIMKANNSRIKLKGDYYGFSYKSKDDSTGKTTSNTSSAITINAKNVSLDLSGLDTFALFGRAFVSSGTDGADASLSSNMMDIMTGQSLAVKVDQGAYMPVNDTYLKIDSNPISKEVLQNYAIAKYSSDPGFDVSAPHLSLDMKTDIVDFTRGKARDIYPYLDPDTPLRAIYYNQGTSEPRQQMVNFYYNFKDEANANAYFQKYYNENKEAVISRFQQVYRLDSGNYALSLPVASSITRFQVAGDILFYNEDSSNYEVTLGDTNGLSVESGKLQDTYKSVKLNLRENGSITQDINTHFYVDDHFDLNYIKTNSNPDPIDTTCVTKYLAAPRDAKVYISNAAEFVVDDTMAGIVIATGDVRVDAMQFEGVIIADGEIKLSSSTELYANEKLVLDILNYCRNNGNKLGSYIKGYGTLKTLESSDDSINYGKAISFENWRKNA